MDESQVTLDEVGRKITVLSIGGSLLGGLVAFVFLRVLGPVPSGAASVRSLNLADIALFALSAGLIFLVALVLGNWLQRPITTWYAQLEAGAPPQDIPAPVARRVLNSPLLLAGIIGFLCLLAALLFGLLFNDIGNFVGIAAGGVVTTAIVYSLSDLIWRDIVPVFFPDGVVSTVPAFHLWVRRRLMLAFILIGALTPTLLVVLTAERSRYLEAAPNPEALLNNLMLVQLFILVTGVFSGLLVALLVARAIVAPLESLQQEMRRIEKGDFDARVEVNTNDELGYLSEGFNHMTAGLLQGEKLRRLFGLYVSPEVARSAVETGAGLGGELAECSIMFSDIRNFTGLSEQITPHELVDLINAYMTAMVRVVVECGGLVTQFGGDSIMVVFGTPLNPMSDHAARAVDAALQVRQALVDFNRESAHNGRPIVDNGVGIASGPVIAGNVGGSERIEYTVMGDAVNLASRLEGRTKEFNFPILISEPTYLALDEALQGAAQAIVDVQIRGKRDAQTVYALTGEQ